MIGAVFAVSVMAQGPQKSEGVMLVVKNTDPAKTAEVMYKEAIHLAVKVPPKSKSVCFVLNKLPIAGGFTIGENPSNIYSYRLEEDKGYYYSKRWTLVVSYSIKAEAWRTMLREYDEETDGPCTSIINLKH